MMIRWMCGVTMKDRNSNEELRERLGIVSVSDTVRQGRLRWFGHVERKGTDDWVSACRNIEVDGKRGRGRGRKTWKESLLDVLHRRFAVEGIPLLWFQSYLTNRTQSISVDGVQSKSFEMDCSVPQGSVLGPLEFISYT